MVWHFSWTCSQNSQTFYKEANLISTFTVLDAEDQLRVIKRICKDNNLEESSWPAKQNTMANQFMERCWQKAKEC
ncbi:MAG: hypothetical protein CM15mP127_12200 [Gammaproteobacteria bacterium]|nr:MAG: hypothetical protein CM15mP127_12200 [Gammaproteobacteria bacterium]